MVVWTYIVYVGDGMLAQKRMYISCARLPNCRAHARLPWRTVRYIGTEVFPSRQRVRHLRVHQRRRGGGLPRILTHITRGTSLFPSLKLLCRRARALCRRNQGHQRPFGGAHPEFRSINHLITIILFFMHGYRCDQCIGYLRVSPVTVQNSLLLFQLCAEPWT